MNLDANGEWRKAKASDSNASCVEVTVQPTATGVRDTKDRQGGHLLVSRDSWRAFLNRLN